ncbi:conserved hypothetical protein [Coccidioides posadasii str. Silveira]|uniref:Major facilitator superfamily (MFS) profile domain-containing protein n=2 Tax=Coccidioides posadasii (strain RMSCC 757 / Silveira) TaxID=443226 RepID=E9D898_COCPS|nr:conserved hypothetical protein [Coccidioides posadasii str. Silveira]
MDTKSASVEEVENPSLERPREKNVESSLEQTYIHAGLTPEVASFLANFSEERRKKCIRKVILLSHAHCSISYPFSDRSIGIYVPCSWCYTFVHTSTAPILVRNAKIEGLLTDLKLSGTQYSFAVSIFFLPYVICEVPSNVLLSRFKRPSTYIGIITVGWGIAMTLRALSTISGGLVATRLAVVPPWRNPASNCTIYCASALSGAFSGLLAFAIAKMRGIGGYNGWRWIFIIEGLASIALSAFAFFALVDSPALSKRWLEPDEIRYLELRQRAQRGRVVVDEDPGKFDWSTLWQVVTDWQLYLQIINFWGNAVPNYGLKFTMPQIIKNMGYSSAKAQSLTVPPYMLGGLVTYVSSLLSDRCKWRFPFIIFG